MSLQNRVTPKELMMYEGFHFSREIRDPIYGYIHLTNIENEIIDTDEFQRLDRLYQTPSAHFVYPNATHTRKSHSLGVMHLSHLSLFQLLFHQCPDIKKVLPPLLTNACVFIDVDKLDDLSQDGYNEWWNSKSYIELLQIIRIAGLLHDIGHGPFSHIFEDVCNSLHEKGKCDKFSHEDMSVKIIEEKLSEKFPKPLSCNDVICVLSKEHSQRVLRNIPFLSSLIDGPYDVDKLDYLGRDSFHSGTHEYGRIDYKRILNGFRVQDGRLLISKSALGSVMDSFTAAQYMYTNVYYHKTSRIFDLMLYDALSVIPSLLNELLDDLDFFLNIDDHNILMEIKNRRKYDDAENNYTESFNIIERVLNRKKDYKAIYEKMLTLSVVSNQEGKIRDLSSRLESKYCDYNTKIDVSTQVKPIRINPLDLISWLLEDVIYDDDDKIAKNLKNVSLAYFSSLTKSQVIFRILVDREKYNENPEADILRELKEETKSEINRIEKFEAIPRA